MGNDSSTQPPPATPTMQFTNCTSEDIKVSNIYHPDQTITGNSNSPCSSYAFPYDAVDYTITRSNGEIYTLSGISITNLGYSRVYLWNSIQIGSSISDDNFCSSGGTCTKGSYLSPGLHFSFNNQSVVAIVTINSSNNFVLGSVSFSSVLTYTNPPSPPPQDPQSNPQGNPPDTGDGNGGQPSKDPTTDPKNNRTFLKIFLVILFILIVSMVIIAAVVLIRKKNK